MTLIDRFLTGQYTVTRTRKGTYIKGFYQAGLQETIQVRGSLQPTNGRELKLPEEGNRLKQYYKFFTDAPIVVINTRTLADSDRIEINGESYRAMSSLRWQNVDLEHYVTIVWRQPEQ